MQKQKLLEELSNIYTNVVQIGSPHGTLFDSDPKISPLCVIGNKYCGLFKIDPGIGMYSSEELIFRKVSSVLLSFVDNFVNWTFIKAFPRHGASDKYREKVVKALNVIRAYGVNIEFFDTPLAGEVLRYLERNQGKIPYIHLNIKRTF